MGNGQTITQLVMLRLLSYLENLNSFLSKVYNILILYIDSVVHTYAISSNLYYYYLSESKDV